MRYGISFGRGLLVASIAITTGCTSQQLHTELQSASRTMPNIVIIYADDMGYGDMAIQNPESKIPTPNLDQLAQEGIRFTDGHSSSGICSPSRYALLTGRYHWRKFHGIVKSFGGPAFDRERLTLPEMLQQKGYRTAAVGKWHLGWDWESIKRPGAKPHKKNGFAPQDFDWSRPVPGGPLDHGFDYYFGDGTINFPPYAWIENDRFLEAPSEAMTLGKRTTSEGSWSFRSGPQLKDWDPYRVLPTLTEKGVDWIRKQKKDEPFFLYFSLPSPHAPIIPNEPFVGKSEAGGYGDFMYQTDHVAGELLDALEEAGLQDDTIVIFTSDNGPEKYAFERVRNHDHRSMGELRGLKRDIWEGGHRVPFVVRWPGVVEPGQVSDALVGQIDLMATIAGIVGFELPDDAAEDSIDQSSVWKNDADSVRSTLVHNTHEDRYAIRDGDWVLIDHKTGSMSRMPGWFIKQNKYDTDMPNGGLYNVREDIGQRDNRIDEFPDKAQEMRALLAKTRDQGYSAPRLGSQSFADRLQYVGTAVRDPEHHVWGCSPVTDDDGIYHLFCARFNGAFTPGWYLRSEIAHYVSDSPQGPFEFADVVWKGSGDKNAWDTGGPHNPVIARVDGKYALFAIARSQKNKGKNRENQSIGLMVADSPYGPWEKAGSDGQVLAPSSDPEHWTFKSFNGVCNPAFLKLPNGKYHLYYKSEGMKMGVAIADNLAGPYRHHPEPVTKNDRIIEDSYAFRRNNKVYLLTTDNHGMIETGGGLLWESDDGVNFAAPTRGFYPLDHLLPRTDYPDARMVYGKRDWKLERPQLLMENGEPAWLYAPSGVNIHGREHTENHVLRVVAE